MTDCSLQPTERKRHHQPVRQLFYEYARTRDVELRNRLVLMNEPLARCIAARFEGSANATRDDLGQIACLGLITAIERFEPNKGHGFAAFAVPTIVGVIKNHLRDHSWFVKVPRSLRELGRTARRVAATMEAERGQVPTVPEVAQRLGVTAERLAEAIEVQKLYQLGSLDLEHLEAATPAEAATPGPPSLSSLPAAAEPRYSEVETRAVVWSALQKLPPRERWVIHERFFLEHTQAEVAARIRMSQMYVSRLEHRALERLRGLLAASERMERSDFHPK
jgi:RNA polymerase sigma-B factor